jgi:hypothetical protein
LIVAAVGALNPYSNDFHECAGALASSARLIPGIADP